MTTNSPPAVRSYLARVRTALADLPAAEVDEILDDVRPHLLEIAGELGEDAGVESMSERIGTPESYAAELRAAGDYPAPPPPGEAGPARRGGARLALWTLVAAVGALGLTGLAVGLSMSEEALIGLVLVVPFVAASAWYVWQRGTDRVAELPEVRRLRAALRPGESGRATGVLGYLRSLRPAWWLVCAVFLVVLGLLFVVSSSGGFLVLLLLLGLAALVIWAGPRSGADRRLLWLSLPVSAFVAGGALGLTGYLGEVVDDRHSYPAEQYPYHANTVDGEPALYYGEEHVENVYAFDSDGEALTDVYLYGQDGRPLVLPRYTCEEGTGAKARIGADNRFPRPHIWQGAYDDLGRYNGYNAYRPECRESAEVPFTVAIPKTSSPKPTG
ncbi:HAAS signaling domain-containing protein [Qaidamihabitans albus]|uniref:HAAS signaling domain-containing protein n=1 Tax=Qaidamihabitans albus TaxID=2795733 RepID=UPI0018F1491B|nr:hypothetical protein [Qaidamihabitans albus]